MPDNDNERHVSLEAQRPATSSPPSLAFISDAKPTARASHDIALSGAFELRVPMT